MPSALFIRASDLAIAFFRAFMSLPIMLCLVPICIAPPLRFSVGACILLLSSSPRSIIGVVWLWPIFISVIISTSHEAYRLSISVWLKLLRDSCGGGFQFCIRSLTCCSSFRHYCLRQPHYSLSRSYGSRHCHQVWCLRTFFLGVCQASTQLSQTSCWRTVSSRELHMSPL